MKTLACIIVLVCVLASISTAKKYAPPMVQVYSSIPSYYGTKNNLTCHVSGFQPPDITIEILKDDVEIRRDAVQTNMVFDTTCETGWQYLLTKTVPFTPEKGEVYTCMVTHVTGLDTKRTQHTWENDVGHV